MPTETIDTVAFSERFRNKFGDDAVFLQGIKTFSSLVSNLCVNIDGREELSQAEIIEEMANAHIVLDQLTVLFSSQIQKYMSRVNEKKKNNLLRMTKALESFEQGQ